MKKSYSFLLLVMLCSIQVNSQILAENTTGSFVFTPQSPLNRPPVEVFYHIPTGDITTMPILMSFHGADRDGANHRDYWINMANANGFMVFAPEFTNTNYPGLGDNYIMSNIFDDGDNPSPATYNDPNEWTCSVIDPLFDFIKADISGSQQKYSAWGHSAGAQFLHRLFMYLPDNKIDVAVCSNAGWYTVPDNTVSYPYGILNGQLPDADLTAAFSNNLIIHLGQNDIVPSTSSGGPRNNFTVNTQQGLTRLDRGEYFFNTSQTTAQNMTVPFNWEKHEVSNIGHDAQLMANDALQFFLQNFLSVDAIEENKFIKIYPNPSNTGFINILSSNSDAVMNVQIYDILGKQVIDTRTKSKKLNVSTLISGVYFLKLVSGKFSSIKKIIIK